MGKVANPRFLRDSDLTLGIEALFFAYRGFTNGPDELLAKQGLGRAHHRALHFISRAQGLSVGELLDILDIKKQSLSRVLRDLVDQGYVEQREGELDRRVRHLFLTDAGKQFVGALSTAQITGVRQAYAAAGADAVEGFLDVLLNLMSEEDRARLSQMHGLGE